ncbi:MAG: YwiC-like family protein, partial [Anaerolineales bacterium]|nr:YwiC-like family protein [Anaerolineales bacterium]
MPRTSTRPFRAMWRKQLVLPAEHGAWAWLLVPFAVGAAEAGRLGAAVWLLLPTCLALFLLRQPATVWLRARQGRAR